METFKNLLAGRIGDRLTIHQVGKGTEGVNLRFDRGGVDEWTLESVGEDYISLCRARGNHLQHFPFTSVKSVFMMRKEEPQTAAAGA